MSHFALVRAAAGALIAGATFAGTATPAAAADTIIDLTYDSIMDMVRPMNYPGISVHHNLEVVLSAGNRVTEKRDRSTKRYSDNNAIAQKLGGDSGTYASWHVASKDQLVRVERDPQSTRTMTVTLTSPTTCKLDVKDELKPGFSEYAFLRVSVHELGYFSSYRVVSTSCTIR